MSIHCQGFTEDISRERWEADFRLLKDNLELLLDRQNTILDVPEYFFCAPAFASCNWPYVAGSGPIYLGYLVQGWNNGVLTDDCPDCTGKLLITSFAGSPLSGSNSWYGLCLGCRKEQKSSSQGAVFINRLKFILSLRATYPASTCRSEDYVGMIFDWAAGLKPAKMNRLITTPTADALTLINLIAELNSGSIRGGHLLSRKIEPGRIEIELRTKNGAVLHPQTGT